MAAAGGEILQQSLTTVREFLLNLRVNKCKAKVVKQFVERRHNQKPPVASTATAVPIREDGRDPTVREGAQKRRTKMKRHAYMMIALMVLVGSMAVAAQAQTGSRTQLVANIPFQFNVGDKAMPAGEYTVSQVNPSSDHAVLQLRSKDGKNTMMIQMTNMIGKRNETARLVFNRYGNDSYFAEAWIPSDANGLRANRSKSERAARQELAGVKPATETVALKARSSK